MPLLAESVIAVVAASSRTKRVVFYELLVWGIHTSPYRYCSPLPIALHLRYTHPMRFCALVVCSFLLVGSLASADEVAMDRDEEAHLSFELGRRHYERGEFLEAGEAFERSHGYSGRSELLYNAYIAYRDANDDANAARTLRLYLEAVEETTEPRVVLEGRLDALEAGLAQGTPNEEEELQEVPAGPASDADSVHSEQESATPIGAVVLTLAGAAAVVSGVISGVITRGIQSDITAQCPDHTCVNVADHQADIDRGRRFARTTDALLFGGGALVLGGVLWWVLGGSDSDEESTRVTAVCADTGCQIGARGSF